MSEEKYLEGEDEKSRCRVLSAFMASNTEAELVMAAQVQSKIIQKMSQEDRKYLRTMYLSRLDHIKDLQKPEPKILKGE